MGAFTLYNTPFGFQIYELNYCCVSMNSEENMAVLYILGQSFLKRLFHVFHVLEKGKQIASPTIYNTPIYFWIGLVFLQKVSAFYKLYL